MSVTPPEWIKTPSPPPIAPARARATGDGLALWGMLLGLIGVLLSPVAGGFLFGPAGLVFAAMAQARPMTNPSRVTVAMGLSVAALMISAFASVNGLDRLFSGGIYAWEGVRAPDFTLQTVDGSTVKLSELRGKRVFVDVWATWCPPCRAMQPDLNRLVAEWGDKGVVVLGLSTDSHSVNLADYAEQRQLAYAVGRVEHDFPKPYVDVASLPTLFVVDRNGVFIAVEEGQHSYTALDALARIPDYGGHPKDPPGTDPAGAG